MNSDPKRFEQAPALRTSAGQVIRLPRPFNVAEFVLPGNHREFKSGVVAVYDGSSETGAVWIPTVGRWLIRQPVSRTEFMDAIEEGEQTQAAIDAGLH